MRHTNLTDDMFIYCALSEAGFGSVAEMKALDTPDLLDLLEYLQIKRAIEAHELEKAHGNNH